MKLKTRYRLLMIFIVILLSIAASLIAYGESLSPDHKISSGKIMISRGYKFYEQI